MSAPRALVTGAAGFLGRVLVGELERRGFGVVPLDRPERGLADGLDLSDEGGLRARVRQARPDLVFHLAGAFKADGYARLLHVNCHLAAVLLDALAAEGLADARMVFVGSAAEYGPLDAEEGPVDEARAARPTSAYGVTKLAQTELALAASRAGRRALVVRPSNVIGPGMSDLLSVGSFARQACAIRDGKAEPALHVGDLGAVRDFVDARDVACAMIDLAQSDQAFGRVFNVSRGSGHTLGDALGALLRAFGLSVELRVDAARGSQSGNASRFVASPQRLASVVPFHPRPLDESMTWIAASTR